MEDFPEKRHRRTQLDLNVVPILDMLVSIIFFLLLTTTFVGYSKLTIPPAQVSTISNPITPPPPNPKLLAVEKGKQLHLLLVWEGANPGSITKKIEMKSIDEMRKNIITEVDNLIKSFLQTHKDITSIQIGLGANVNYQILVSIMDGTLIHLKDHVLISYEEAEALVDAIGS